MTKKEHLIRTRNPEHTDYIFEDLLTFECTVCGHKTLTEGSEFYVNSVRDKIRRDMKRMSTPSSEQTPHEQKKEKINISFLKDTLRKWIG